MPIEQIPQRRQKENICLSFGAPWDFSRSAAEAPRLCFKPIFKTDSFTGPVLACLAGSHQGKSPRPSTPALANQRPNDIFAAIGAAAGRIQAAIVVLGLVVGGTADLIAVDSVILHRRQGGSLPSWSTGSL